MAANPPAPDLFPGHVMLAAEAQSVAREQILFWHSRGITTASAWEALGNRGRWATWAKVHGFIIRWWIGQHSEHLTTVGREEGDETMSRIRSVHPSQWTEEDFVQCSMPARLLLLGLRNEADDRGVFEWRPISLKLRLLPADDLDIDVLLAELVEHRQIARFGGDGAQYGLCLSWDQTPRHPAYRYPEPPSDLAATSTIRRSATAESGNAPADAGGRTPESVEESESESEREGARATAPVGALLSLEDDLPDAWQEEAATAREAVSLAPVNLAAEWAKFRHHNAGKRRRDWRRRWLNWALNARGSPADRGAPAPAEAAAEQPARPVDRRAVTWGRPPEWWRKFDPTQQSKTRAWVERGTWRGIGGPPGSPNCLIEAELAEAAVAERARRLREQPELGMMPLKGGGKAAEPAAAERDAGPAPLQREAG